MAKGSSSVVSGETWDIIGQVNPNGNGGSTGGR